MKEYTVLLLYPDYLTGGEVETYLAWVSADTPSLAVRKAQKQAWRANTSACYNDGSEFEILAVFEGHLSDLNPGAQRCIL